MSSAQFVEIGTIQRTHGVNGEFQVTWNSNFYLEEQNLESVFIELEGIPVPFFITSIRPKGEDKALIKLEEIEDIGNADEFVGLKLLLPSDQIESNDELLMSDLVGFTLINTQKQLIGNIVDYQEYQTNSVFTISHQSGKDLMIPAVDELIIEVDTENKIVTMEIPDGLIDLYLE